MDNFAQLSAKDKKPYFEIAAEKTTLDEHIIEKDFWVCWVLKQLFTLPSLSDQLIFKGGTSLSKVFQVIDRFSEDIDISVSKELLGFSGDKDPEKAKSSKQRNASIEELSLACKHFVQTPIKKELQNLFKKILNPGDTWKLEVDKDDNDGQTLLFYYSAISKSPAQYVHPVVKIEIGARSDHWPAHAHDIRSFLAEHVPDSLSAPIAKVKTLDAARTFWEKATILHSFFHYPENKIPAERQSRHFYDFFKLLQTRHKKEALRDLKLLARVAEHKSIYFRAGWAKYNEAVKGTLKLSPSPRIEELMRRDYNQMREMFFVEPPSWSEILKGIRDFELEFNHQEDY